MKINKQTQEALLKEYETARSTFNQVEGNIWQTAAVFIVLSLGGVSVLFTLTEHSWSNFIAVTGIGVISIFILWYWLGTVNRWWSLESILLYRMREIEAELGLWTQRYIYYMDRTRIYKDEIEIGQKDKIRFSKLNEKIPHYTKTPARVRIRVLISVLAIGWIVLIARELALTLGI